jgi:hypothetical protein
MSAAIPVESGVAHLMRADCEHDPESRFDHFCGKICCSFLIDIQPGLFRLRRASGGKFRARRRTIAPVKLATDSQTRSGLLRSHLQDTQSG